MVIRIILFIIIFYSLRVLKQLKLHSVGRKLTVFICDFFNPLTPVPAVTGHDEPNGLSCTSDIIIFDQNLHYLCLPSSVGKYLSSDVQIRVIGLMEPERCTKHKNAQNVE